jgi:hypothetical protein
MTAQRGSKRKRLAAKPKKGTTVTNEKSKVKREAATPRNKVKERARLKLNEPLTKTHGALQSAEVEVQHQRQARNKGQKASNKARVDLVAGRPKTEQEYQAQTRRASFIVRLTLDENGQFGRTEIEHASSGRKQNFLSLDGEHLVAFMKAGISPLIISKPAIPPVGAPKEIEGPTPGQLIRPKTNLVVSDIQLFNSRTPNVMGLTLMSEEPFIVQVRFQLQGPEAHSLTAQEHSYEMKVYFKEITSGKSMLVITYNAQLIQNVLAYTVPTEVPGLSHGLYRLFTVITLGGDVKTAGYHEGPMLQVL